MLPNPDLRKATDSIENVSNLMYKCHVFLGGHFGNFIYLIDISCWKRELQNVVDPRQSFFLSFVATG